MLIILSARACCLFDVALAQNDSALNFGEADEGLFYVYYDDGTGRKVKMGIRYGNGKTAYDDYIMGQHRSYVLDNGSGTYKITVNVHVSGSTYRVVESKYIKVEMATGTKEANAKYLKSVTEIRFKEGDSVSLKAEKLTEGLKSDSSKVIAIYNYILDNFTYDNELADKINSGIITQYTPRPTSILKAKKGICYDLASLMAAMTRSIGIPCKLVKGYCTKISTYHAWNSVYIESSDKWYTLDLTRAIAKGDDPAEKMSNISRSSKEYAAKFYN